MQLLQRSRRKLLFCSLYKYTNSFVSLIFDSFCCSSRKILDAVLKLLRSTVDSCHYVMFRNRTDMEITSFIMQQCYLCDVNAIPMTVSSR